MVSKMNSMVKCHSPADRNADYIVHYVPEICADSKRKFISFSCAYEIGLICVNVFYSIRANMWWHFYDFFFSFAIFQMEYPSINLCHLLLVCLWILHSNNLNRTTKMKKWNEHFDGFRIWIFKMAELLINRKFFSVRLWCRLNIIFRFTVVDRKCSRDRNQAVSFSVVENL